MANDGLPPLLILTVEAAHELRADYIAAIVARLSAQFESYQKRRAKSGNLARLRIKHLGTGSAIIHLIAVADALAKLHENVGILDELRDLLAGFYNQLLEAFEIVSGLRGGRLRVGDRKTLQILAAPVANDNAKQVCLQNFGDNATIIVITADEAATLLPKIEGRLETMLEDVIATSASVETDLPDQTPAAVANRFRPPQTPFRRRVQGTLIDLRGHWYVRFLGGEGTMVPLRNSKFDLTKLSRNREYAVEGHLILNGTIVTGFSGETVVIASKGN